jgi:hypothetical protein
VQKAKEAGQRAVFGSPGKLVLSFFAEPSTEGLEFSFMELRRML